MKKLELQIVIWKEGRHYVAQCLNIDVSSFGTTKKAAIKNIHEALELYFEDGKISKVCKVERPIVVKHQLQYA